MITIDEFIEQNKNCLHKGWVYMDSTYKWYFVFSKPTLSKGLWKHKPYEFVYPLSLFDIEVIDDYTKSLRKIIPEDENVEIPF